jgi:hypothetical protein
MLAGPDDGRNWVLALRDSRHMCEEPGVSKGRIVNSYLEIFSSMSALSTPWGGSHAKESGRKSKTAPQSDTERMGDSPALGRFRGWFWGVGGVGKRVSAGHEELGSSFQWLGGLVVRVNQRTAAFAVDIVSLSSTFSVRAASNVCWRTHRGDRARGASSVDFRASPFAKLAQ